MNTFTISQKPKNKHLQFFHYEFIVNELNRFNAVHSGHKRNIGKTQFIHYLADSVGTSVSNTRLWQLAPCLFRNDLS